MINLERQGLNNTDSESVLFKPDLYIQQDLKIEMFPFSDITSNILSTFLIKWKKRVNSCLLKQIWGCNPHEHIFMTIACVFS